MELLEHPYNWGLALLYGYAHDLPEQIHDRVFISLDWYMRSCRAGIVETESLVNLAIALESLLRITQEKSERITERFRDAILTLLGPVPLLDSWIVQFYDARSEAVHKGEASDLQFYPSGKAVPKTQESKQKQSEPPVPHRSLLDYGRRVFRLCLATVIAGAQHTHMTGLGAMLIPNSDRFTTLCKILNSSEAPCKRIRDCSRLITELHEFSFNVKQPAFTQVIGAVKLILSAYKEALPLLFQKIESNVNQLNALPKDKMSEMDNCMEEIIRQLQGEMAHERDPLTTVVLGLLRYAVQPLFKLHDWNVRRSLGSEGPDSSD
jgi:hypothetical protein